MDEGKEVKIRQLEKQIEGLQRALNSKAEENANLTNENLRLKAQLRAAGVMGVGGSGFMQGIAQATLEQATELERALAYIEQLERHFNERAQWLVEAFGAVANLRQATCRRADEQEEKLVSHTTDRPLPAISAALWQMGDVLKENFNETTLRDLRDMHERNGLSMDEMPDPKTHSEIYVYAIFMAGIDIGVHLKRGLLLGVAPAFVDDPRVVADEIIRECKEKGAPSMETLQRLPMEWIEDNLPEPPKKYDTLRDGLTKRQNNLNSGMNAKSYYHENKSRAIDSAMNERVLRRYKRWYEALENAANEKPENTT